MSSDLPDESDRLTDNYIATHNDMRGKLAELKRKRQRTEARLVSKYRKLAHYKSANLETSAEKTAKKIGVLEKKLNKQTKMIADVMRMIDKKREVVFRRVDLMLSHNGAFVLSSVEKFEANRQNMAAGDADN